MATKQEISVKILDNIPDNTTRRITPEKLREVLNMMNDYNGAYIEVLRSDLKTLKDNAQLQKGSHYKITDFATMYEQRDYTDAETPVETPIVKTADVSPIVVLATSENTLSSFAFQPEFPDDIIQYEIDYITPVTLTETKGRITYRKDNQGNECNWDFRTVLVKRYMDSSENYSSYYDLGFGSAEFLTFASYYSQTFNNRIFHDNILDHGMPNIVFMEEIQNIDIHAYIENVTLLGSAINWNVKYRLINFSHKGNIYNCTFENVVNVTVITSTSSGFNVFHYFQNVSITAGNIWRNTINGFSDSILNVSNFTENQINGFENCDITSDAYFTGNKINTRFRHNIINLYFAYNNIELIEYSNFNGFQQNKGKQILHCEFDEGCYGNDFGVYFSFVTVGLNFGKDIDNNFGGNKILSLNESTIGANFHNNELTNECYGLTIGDNMNNNIIRVGLDSLDLTPATHIYENYNCEVLKNSNGDIVLSYLDEVNARSFTLITD